MLLPTLWKRLTDIPASDPDDARRRRLLSIILIGLTVMVGMLSLLLIGLYLRAPSAEHADALRNISGISAVALLGFAALYWINRYRSGQVASLLFVAFFFILLFNSDTPQEIVGGRSTYYVILPIIIASILFRPSASFVAAGFAIAVYLFLAWRLDLSLDIFAPPVFLMTALLAWLSAHTLQTALEEVRRVNRDLDRRVNERTRDLQDTLLREQTEAGKNRAIVQSIGDSVMVFDAHGWLALGNPALSRLLDREWPEMIGQPLERILPLEAAPQQTALQAALADPASARPIQIDWRKRIYSLHVAPVALESGHSGGLVAVLHDVTDEVEVSRMKSAFVAMVSHELRTPLSAILGMAEILHHMIYGPLNDKQHDVVQRIMVNITRLTGLVKDLLDQAQIEAGTLAIQVVAFSPADLMESLKDNVSGMVQLKHIALVTQIDPALPPNLLGDPLRLNQILINLVTNALKFTQEGQIGVRFSQPEPGKWAMAVSDTGPGIAPEAQQRIFEPFWQVDSSLGRKLGGAGLGLAIVHQLTQLMNGQIRLDSQVGTGSTFSVTFPLQIPEPAASVQPEKSLPDL